MQNDLDNSVDVPSPAANRAGDETGLSTQSEFDTQTEATRLSIQATASLLPNSDNSTSDNSTSDNSTSDNSTSDNSTSDNSASEGELPFEAEPKVAINAAPLVPRTQFSLVGGLISAIMHMVLMIAAGLLFMKVQQQAAMDIQFSVANTRSESLDELSVEVDLSAEAPSDSAPIASVATSSQLSMIEPELLSEFGDVAARSEEVSALSQLSDAVEPPSSKTDGAAGSNGSKSDSGDNGTFFGAKAYGDEFVYVVDMSTSMGARSQYGQTRFRVACRELLRSINNLTPSQKFCVFMFSYRTRVMFDGQPMMIAANSYNKQRIAQWINGLGLGAGTDPRYGTMMALRLKPDAIFLLSDGEFNGRDMNTHGIRGNPPIERLISKYRKDKVPIHTIAFEDTLNRKRLRRIASGTDGTHRFVGPMGEQDLLLDDLRSNHPSDVAFGLQSLLDGSQKLHDDLHLERATVLIANQFKSRDKEIRALALEAMLFLSNGVNLGPESPDASHRTFVAARKEWIDYWSQHFKDKRASRGKRREQFDDERTTI